MFPTIFSHELIHFARATMENINIITAWVRLHGMSIHYNHKRVLRRLGKIIGHVLKINYNTTSATRGKFARIVVELCLKKTLCLLSLC